MAASNPEHHPSAHVGAGGENALVRVTSGYERSAAVFVARGFPSLPLSLSSLDGREGREGMKGRTC